MHQSGINWGNIGDFMSALKMVVRGDKTLKTTIQKNVSKYQKFAGKVSVAEFCYTQTFFLRFVVILIMILKLMIWWNFILKLHIQSLVKHLRWSFFFASNQRVKAVDYFRRRALSFMFDRILNATLANNLL